MEYDIVVPPTADGALKVKVGKWMAGVGDPVVKSKDLVEMTTEKIALYASSPVDGVLLEIVIDTGAEAKVGDLLGRVRAE